MRRSRVKLIRVDDRSTSVVACLSGAAATLSGASPVGNRPLDAIVLLLVVGVVTWASASAAWWAIALAAGSGALLAVDLWVTLVGAVACLAGYWLGTQRRNLSAVRATVGGVAVNVLCRMEFVGFLGATALVGVTMGFLLLVMGLRRRHSALRKWAFWSGLGLAGLAALAAIGVGVAAQTARADVTAGRRLVAEGIDLLQRGEYDDAAASFDQAAASFRSAQASIGRPWAQPARLVPVAAQNREAVAVISTRAASASAQLANAALFIDPSDLKVVEGRFDLEALAEIEAPLTAAYTSMVELRSAIDAVDSPWLLTQVDSPLQAAAAEFDDNIDQVDTAVQALQLAPGMLGGDGVRNYFVAFTTPAEARGQGGFMGNYAVLTADHGALSMTEFGRTQDLNDGGAGERRLNPPREWAEAWGRYGFTNGPNGSTGSVPWSNITMSPHFPSTAQVIAELFPQSGGRQVDGVFAFDPYVLQTLIGFTGPVSIDAGEPTDRLLTDTNTAQFLLFDQYAIEDAETRIDLLEAVAELVIDQVFAGALPGPTVLADRLVPLADEGRLVGWMSDADEQTLFDRIGITGGLPDHTGADGFQVVVNNGAANKLDAYLDRSIRYRAQFDRATRSVVGTIDVTFTNNGPTSGLPSGVIGNYTGDPLGTNRSLVTVYSVLPVIGCTADGQDTECTSHPEAGWNATTLYLVLPPGESHTISLTVAGGLPIADADQATYQLVIGTQPLVLPAEYDIEVTDVDSEVLFELAGRSPGHQRFVAKPPEIDTGSN